MAYWQSKGLNPSQHNPGAHDMTPDICPHLHTQGLFSPPFSLTQVPQHRTGLGADTGPGRRGPAGAG